MKRKDYYSLHKHTNQKEYFVPNFWFWMLVFKIPDKLKNAYYIWIYNVTYSHKILIVIKGLLTDIYMYSNFYNSYFKVTTHK